MRSFMTRIARDLGTDRMKLSVNSEHVKGAMMYMRPGENEQYGYRLKNYFTGEVLAERRFKSRGEMEAGLAFDLAPDHLLGGIFRDLDTGGKVDASE